jgi:hypothetical protein
MRIVVLMTPNTLVRSATVILVSQILEYKISAPLNKIMHAYDEVKKNCRTTSMKLFKSNLIRSPLSVTSIHSVKANNNIYKVERKSYSGLLTC